MFKRKKPIDPHRILPGDTLYLIVPENRLLEAGTYTIHVDAESKSSRLREKSYICSFDICEDITVSFRLSIPKSPKLAGQAFLGLEQFPVEYKHEPNLERRLAASIDALQKERPRHGD